MAGTGEGPASDAAEPEPPGPGPPPPAEDKAEPDTKKKQKTFECQQCQRVFQHRNSLLYHVLSHSGKQHVCRECGKGFYTMGALKIHKRVHNGDRPYKCEICGRDFRQWSDLKYHKVSIHSDQKSFKCEFCGKDFARKYSLNVHRRIHTGERNYPCDYCNKTFRASSYRLSHMRTHTGDRPHQCTTCGKAFRVRGDLRRHLATHDKRPPDKPRPAKQDEHAEEDIKLEVSKNIKKIALASTAKSSNILKTAEKKPKPSKKNQSAKKGAPNVTIDQLDDSYTNNVELCDTRQGGHYAKYGAKGGPPGYKQEQDPAYAKQGPGLKQEHEQEREFAILRPMYRANVADPSHDPAPGHDPAPYRAANTDGKMHVYTHIEKPASQAPLSDLRPLDRDVRSDLRADMRPDLHGESAENEFIERLTALYNIPAV